MEANKVAFLISSLGGGGAERVCSILANGLILLGWNIDIVILSHVSNNRLDSISPKVNIHALNVTRARYAPRLLNKYLDANLPDAVVTFSDSVAMLEYVASFFRPRTYKLICRCMTTLSSVVYQNGGGVMASLQYLLLKRVLISADIIVNQCLAMKNDTLRELKAGKVKQMHIYNPVLSVDTEHQSGDCNEDYILCVGRLDKNKDFAWALRSFAKLKDQYPLLQLFIAGVGGLENTLKELARQLDILNRVRFLGFQKDLSTLYSGAKLVSLTSVYEGFPNILLEAISHGTPVVAYDCPNGPREIIVDEENGYLVETRTDEGLANSYSKALAKEWSDEKIISTIEKFKEPKILHQWDSLLYSTCSNKV